MNNIFYPIRLSDLWFLDENGNVNLFSDNDLLLNNYEFNEVGSFIWKLCDGKFSNHEIAKLLLEITEGDKPDFQIILDDVNNFLKDLQEDYLVNWVNEENLDVLLVVPPYPILYSSKAIKTPEYSAPPLGLAYIGAVLKSNGYKVAIYDMHIAAANAEDILKEYRRTKPKIVGITCTTPTFPNAVRIAKLLKAWDKNIVTVIGGVHVTSLPEESLELGCFDYVSIGEGEQSMLELADLIIKKKGNTNDIRGLAFKDNSGKNIFTLPILKPKDLDYLPYPARELLDIDLYYQKGSIISTRGCPYDCTYCACPLVTGRKYRKHSVDYVLDEIRFVQEKYKINYFDFHDDTFNLIPQRVYEFSEKIIERKMNFKWGCFCRATNFSYEVAKAMKDSGCEVVQFGVESGNQEVLDAVRKRATLEEIENAVTVAKKAGITQIACGFIIGHSSDTEESANETIEFGIHLAKLGATRLAISILTPYPGTEEFIRMKENGIHLITNDWEQFIFSRVVLETKNLNKEKLKELYAKGVYKFLEATNSFSKQKKELLPVC